MDTTPEAAVPAEPSQIEPEEDENMEDGQITPEELIQTPYLTDRIQLPAEKSSVVQHVELLFALSVKAPDMLDE
jgi:symplekin